MGKIEETLRSEIHRMAKKEVKACFQPILKQVKKLKKENAILKEANGRLKSLPDQVKRLKDQLENLSEIKTEENGEMREIKKMVDLLYTPEILLSNFTESSKGKSRLSPILIKKLRKKLKLNQTDLGDLVGVSGVTVGYWESGKVKPLPKSKIKILALRQFSAPEVKRML